MGGIGLPELLIALVIIMIIFGAGKLPSLGSSFGNTIRNFKRSIKEPDNQEVSIENISESAGGGNSDAARVIPETLDGTRSKTPNNPNDS